jgi:hypothetical protein
MHLALVSFDVRVTVCLENRDEALLKILFWDSMTFDFEIKIEGHKWMAMGQ